jgi:predicted nucleic acid-binding protein
MTRLAAGDAFPAHVDAEVVAALRALGRRIARLERVVAEALRHLARFPIRRMPLVPLLDRMWELRANVTACDAAYVALAEGSGLPSSPVMASSRRRADRAAHST